MQLLLQFSKDDILRCEGPVQRCALSVVHQAGTLPQSRLFANARPDPDFKYLSNSMALSWFEKAAYATNFQGLNFDVCGDRPSL
jgi:hypothetical protein